MPVRTKNLFLLAAGASAAAAMRLPKLGAKKLADGLPDAPDLPLPHLPLPHLPSLRNVLSRKRSGSTADAAEAAEAATPVAPGPGRHLVPTPEYAESAAVTNACGAHVAVAVVYDDWGDQLEIIEEHVIEAGATCVYGTKVLRLGTIVSVAPIKRIELSHANGERDTLEPSVYGIVDRLRVVIMEDGSLVQAEPTPKRPSAESAAAKRPSADAAAAAQGGAESAPAGAPAAAGRAGGSGLGSGNSAGRLPPGQGGPSGLAAGHAGYAGQGQPSSGRMLAGSAGQGGFSAGVGADGGQAPQGGPSGLRGVVDRLAQGGPSEVGLAPLAGLGANGGQAPQGGPSGLRGVMDRLAQGGPSEVGLAPSAGVGANGGQALQGGPSGLRGVVDRLAQGSPSGLGSRERLVKVPAQPAAQAPVERAILA